MTIQCIAFDLDDTLWDCHPIIQRAEKILYAWLARHYPDITHRYDYHSLAQHRIDFMQQHTELSHNLTQLRKQWFAVLADEAGYEHQMVELAFREFWLARNEVTFFDGVLDTLKHLSSHYQLGVISNGNADVNHIGVGDLFHFTVSSEEAGVAKPHADIFHLSLRKSGLKAEQMVYVGDNYTNDIVGAGNLGIRTIWLNREGLREPENTPHKADAVIQRMTQLPDVITAL